MSLTPYKIKIHLSIDQLKIDKQQKTHSKCVVSKLQSFRISSPQFDFSKQANILSVGGIPKFFGIITGKVTITPQVYLERKKNEKNQFQP